MEVGGPRFFAMAGKEVEWKRWLSASRFGEEDKACMESLLWRFGVRLRDERRFFWFVIFVYLRRRLPRLRVWVYLVSSFDFCVVDFVVEEKIGDDGSRLGTRVLDANWFLLFVICVGDLERGCGATMVVVDAFRDNVEGGRPRGEEDGCGGTNLVGGILRFSAEWIVAAHGRARGDREASSPSAHIQVDDHRKEKAQHIQDGLYCLASPLPMGFTLPHTRPPRSAYASTSHYSHHMRQFSLSENERPLECWDNPP
ncbi:hypothetical protein V8G54_034242 [Vigna mungo]|uniref:Uncharacterized protein n=1 Tax=Vigna mungo TaxID=3915 RepID=A0AAQ3MPD3_VIGMU